MNVFTKYTIESLKKNRTRTIVTIIGIILSVAMFTAVTESIVSGQQYLVNTAIATIGSFHGSYSYLTGEQLEELSQDKTYEEIETLQNIGYAEIGSKNEYKPYLFIGGMSEKFTDMVAVNLIEGRMPEKQGEIVLPRHLYTNGRVEYKIGDVLTLNVGERQYSEGITWSEYGLATDEKLVNTKTRTYTVVGICERPDNKIERYEKCGYTAYTLEENDKSLGYTVFFTVKNIPKWYDDYAYFAQKLGTDVTVNTDVIAFKGIDVGYSIMPVILSLGAILILIIMAGSVSLIYNSFSISVSERTKQFGLLRSIGATKKQMIRTVLTEALLLCAVAVPIGLFSGCLGIGITFKLLSGQFATMLNSAIQTNAVTMKLVPNVYALLAAALISIVTALFSAYIPAKRATKMSAIEAIRMSNDIKIKGRQLKTGKIGSKLFGFSGMLARKNFKRNKKKYRITVISLAMSLILFISASSLCFYFQKTFDMDMETIEYELSVMTNPNVLSNKEAKDAIEEISKTEGIDDYAILSGINTSYITETKNISEKMKDFVYCAGDYAQFSFSRYFVNDESFNRLCKENGIDAKDYYNKDEPIALFYDNMNYTEYDEQSKKETHVQGEILNTDKFPATLDVMELEENKNGGVCNGLDKDGKIIYSTGEKDFSYNIEDCIVQRGIKVGAKIKNKPFYIYNSSTILFYPESMFESVCKNVNESKYYYGYYKAEDYNSVYEKMLKVSDSYGEGLIVENEAEGSESINALMTLVKVFSYGFIALISLIAAANVFNTISTNILLRRRELAMLKSVGMGDKDFKKMMSYESLFYGIKSIILGLPVSLVLTYLIYLSVTDGGYEMSFSLPFGNIIFALASVFAVVFASMVYSIKKLKKYNTADELKNENL